MRGHRAAAGAVRVRRGPGLGGTGRWLAVLGAVWFALAGGSCGGGEDTGAGVVPPVLPPPRPPPPRPPLTDTLFVGFAEDRIEITEGEGAAVGIAFEAFYKTPPVPNLGGWIVVVRAETTPGTGSAEDLETGGARIGDRVDHVGSGATWLALRALADGVVEGPETLRLRLEVSSSSIVDPEGWGFYDPPAVEVTNGELEVVIHDADGAGACSDVSIAGTRPRRVTAARGGACGIDVVYEADVTVESPAGRPLQLDRIDPGGRGRVHDWRVSRRGSRVRHEFVMQWTVWEPWELRVETCPRTGGGPTLVCTVGACETYAAGTSVPAPRRPAGCR